MHKQPQWLRKKFSLKRNNEINFWGVAYYCGVCNFPLLFFLWFTSHKVTDITSLNIYNYSDVISSQIRPTLLTITHQKAFLYYSHAAIDYIYKIMGGADTPISLHMFKFSLAPQFHPSYSATDYKIPKLTFYCLLNFDVC